MVVSTAHVIVVDTNVWLDQYLPARPHRAESHAFMDAALAQGVELAYPASIIKDVFYVVGSEYKRIVRAQQGTLSEVDAQAIQRIAWGVVDNMQEVATPVGIDLSDVWLASKWRTVDGDLEDNLVRAASKRTRADLVVTWDKGMLAKAVVPTVTPTDAIAVMEAWE
jgi:predicted nucleic acid-binding protein